MTVSPKKWTFECSLPSQPGSGHPVIEEILRQLRKVRWPEKDFFGIHMALEEGVNNAIRHGNCCDPLKKVHLRCCLTRDLLRVEIRDEGPGFDPGSLPDPCDPENLLRESGRGVLLIHSYMTRVCYNEKGNVLVFEKERPAKGPG